MDEKCAGAALGTSTNGNKVFVNQSVGNPICLTDADGQPA
jgi:hypothetical protein